MTHIALRQGEAKAGCDRRDDPEEGRTVLLISLLLAQRRDLLQARTQYNWAIHIRMCPINTVISCAI